MEPQAQDNIPTITPEQEQQPQESPIIAPIEKKSGGKGWMIAAICAIIVALGVGAFLAYFMIDNDGKIDDLQAQIDTQKIELEKYRNATNTNNADEIVATPGELDMTKIYKAIEAYIDSEKFEIILKDAEITNNTDGTYQVAVFTVIENNSETGTTIYLYRSTPDGEWTVSENFSGSAVPNCEDITEEEEAAFAGTLECTEE